MYPSLAVSINIFVPSGLMMIDYFRFLVFFTQASAGAIHDADGNSFSGKFHRRGMEQQLSGMLAQDRLAPWEWGTQSAHHTLEGHSISAV